MLETAYKIAMDIKRVNPLILNITNYVTMDLVANGLLSLGASPVMSIAHQEIEDLTILAKSIVINIGTLNEDFIKLCKHTCQIANQLKKSIVLDPVGAGASRYRTEFCLQLMNDYDIAIIRGNASEIMALSNNSFVTKGVDSTLESDRAIENARILSKNIDTTIVISGKIDYVIDNEKLNHFPGGSPLMPLITGTGCLFSAVVGAFHAMEEDRFQAASAATMFYKACGELAEKNSTMPGSYRTEFLNSLSLLEQH